MKIQLTVLSLLAAGILAGCETENPSKLQAEAKISRADAEATAQVKVPDGTVKEAELEREHGRLVWSFGFTTPDSKNITEVNVDAINGYIVSVEHEKPEDNK